MGSAGKSHPILRRTAGPSGRSTTVSLAAYLLPMAVKIRDFMSVMTARVIPETLCEQRAE